jgi:hypothetical protein
VFRFIVLVIVLALPLGHDAGIACEVRCYSQDAALTGCAAQRPEALTSGVHMTATDTCTQLPAADVFLREAGRRESSADQSHDAVMRPLQCTPPPARIDDGRVTDYSPPLDAHRLFLALRI